MEYIAIARNIKMTPRKVRLVADNIKKHNIKSALIALALMNKRAALPIKKTLDSAIANATNNFKANKDSLTIQDIIVYEGTSLKRFHFAARGRVRPYKRRSSHIRVVLSDNKPSQSLKAKAEEPKMIESSKKEEKGKGKK